MDFEAAERLALVEVFGIELQGCFFHFRQAILRRIRNHHCPLHRFITSVENLGNWNILLLFVALAFLKDEDIGRGYQLIVQIPLIQENLDIFQGFLDYFESTWVGSMGAGHRRQPRVQTQWSVYLVTKNRTPKTISAVEGWHRQFRRTLNVERPYTYRFLMALRIQQTLTDTLIDQGGQAQDPYRRNHTLMRLNAIRGEVRRGYNLGSILQYLIAVSAILNSVD